MQKLRAKSRAIITDPIYQRVNEARFKNHLQTIKNPYANSVHTSLKNTIKDKSEQYALQISKYKKARMLSSENIDPVVIQNRSLVKKMEEIDKRKSKSLVAFKKAHASQYKLFNNQIKQENRFIFTRIKDQRQNVMTKKQLKKQFEQVDKMIMHSRRIKETIKRCNKNKKKVQFKFNSKISQFVLTQQGPTKTILNLNIR